MNVDLHTHVKLSKNVPFSMKYVMDGIEQARQAGLDAVAVTEHFNTLNFYEIYDVLDRQFPYIGDYYDVDGFRLFPGMEIDVSEGGHILFIGNRDTIYLIRRELEGCEQEGRFIGMEALLRIASGYDLLKIGAHPYRKDNPLTGISRDRLLQLDALDLNAKDLHKYGIGLMQNKIELLGRELGLPVVAGSDTHHPLQFGSIWNHLEQECSTVAELKQCISRQQHRISISSDLHDKVEAADTMKKLLKASGG